MSDFDVNNFDRLRIALASAETIRSWSRGEVKKPETINYRTLKPERDGLFCEKIFGPTKDWECNCGKYKRVRFKGIICERCGVEVTRSKVRRDRMGHIELAAPVSHIWYFKGSPSRLGYLLDIAPKELEKVLYFAASIITSVDEENREADAVELKEELAADLDEFDAEMQTEIDEIIAERDHLIAIANGEEEPDEFDDVDLDLSPAEQIKRAEKNAESEIEDIREDFEERKTLRSDAFDQFMKLSPRMLIADESLFREMRLNYSNYFTGGMGAEAVRTLLLEINLEELSVELRETIATGKGQKRAKAIKRLKVAEAFIRSSNNPTDMILDVIPVIPPDLRPMVQLDGGRFATSDLNDLYRRVINRNNRLKRLLDLGAPDIIVSNEKRMLQEAVDSLFDNGRRGRPVTGPGNRPLKSISDMLKGKQGRFRQNLLGKRVDYSGRSVIVVGPELKLHQCGLPKKMALELFKPFVMKRLVELEITANIKSSKKLVEREASQVWDVLEEVITDHPVLLNRAPTLHRLGIQAFEPLLVEGKAIRLHPLVCTAFNADFDGDQMAVHVPLSAEAQAEARVLMLSANNIKSPAHGRPLTVPTQDMIIGLFYLTVMREGMQGEGRIFMSEDDAVGAYDSRADVDLQAKVTVRFDRDTTLKNNWESEEEIKAGDRIETTIGRIIFNDSLTRDYPFVNYEVNKKEIDRIVEDCTKRYKLSEMGPILDELKRLGFHYATRAGVTISVWDAMVPPNKGEILAEADQQVDSIEDNYQMGLMNSDERHREIVDIWNNANDRVGESMEKNFDKFNPIYMMAHSGARGNLKQIRQLAGMRGLMANPKGEIIDRPIKANFREGLTVLEYFISTHGARKGLADTALRTADSGYMTRRLVDVAQDVIVREENCGTDEGVTFSILTNKGEVDSNLIGRSIADAIIDPKTGEIILDADEFIETIDQLRAMIEQGVDKVKIRTVMTCHARRGICSKCYGWDLATSRPVNIGTATGIIAAQSIGEPGTQLTMRTFHTGGVAGEDITHGLPRVNELFEARKPKGQAVLSEIEGKLSITTDKNYRYFTVIDGEGNEKEYQVSARAQLMPGIEDGIDVVVGQQLTKGSINPHDLLRLTDPDTTLEYILRQVQDVYVSQGVSINDKHIEVIARQMLRKVTVTESGDSDYLPGRQVDRFEFRAEAERIALEGKEPPVGTPLLLGITKASLATDSFLSAASFQETTKVLTEAAIEGKEDELNGLKENVIIGKPIPAGTGLKRYRTVPLTYRGERVDASVNPEKKLPDYAPTELKDLEELLPSPPEWSFDGEYLGLIDANGEYINIPGYPGFLGRSISSDDAKLYIFDDLGVSQRWANKFSEMGIETVGDLLGKNEADLLKIEGIGVKAIQELRDGLEERGLLHVLEGEQAAVPAEDETDIDVTELLGTVFSPGEDFLLNEPDVLGLPQINSEEDPSDEKPDADN